MDFLTQSFFLTRRSGYELRHIKNTRETGAVKVLIPFIKWHCIQVSCAISARIIIWQMFAHKTKNSERYMSISLLSFFDQLIGEEK